MQFFRNFVVSKVFAYFAFSSAHLGQQESESQSTPTQIRFTTPFGVTKKFWHNNSKLRHFFIELLEKEYLQRKRQLEIRRASSPISRNIGFHLQLSIPHQTKSHEKTTGTVLLHSFPINFIFKHKRCEIEFDLFSLSTIIARGSSRKIWLSRFPSEWKHFSLPCALPCGSTLESRLKPTF